MKKLTLRLADFTICAGLHAGVLIGEVAVLPIKLIDRVCWYLTGRDDEE